MGGALSAEAAAASGGEQRWYLGVDIGGTTISVGVVDLHGALVGAGGAGAATSAASTPTEEGAPHPEVEPLGDDHDPKKVALRVRAIADRALAAAGLTIADLAGVGVCTPGLLDIPQGVVQAAANLKGWRNVPICDLLAAAFAVDRSRIVLENDTNSALLAECWVGAAAGRRNVVLMTLGTGIGGAIMCDGRLLRGSRGQAGELGHSILVPEGREFGSAGVRGIFEAYASASAVAQRSAEAGGPRDCAEVFRRAETGDGGNGEALKPEELEAARTLVRDTARSLAVGCINCCRFVDPEVIIFSGGMAHAGEFLLKQVREEFAAHHWNIEPVRLEIVLASAVAASGVIGAAFAAKDRADLGDRASGA